MAPPEPESLYELLDRKGELKPMLGFLRSELVRERFPDKVYALAKKRAKRGQSVEDYVFPNSELERIFF